MATARDEQQITDRNRAVWFWPVAWPVAIALRWFLGWDAWGPMVLWVPSVALLETNAVLTALRARRGLTLTADGITWHKYEMHVPWANVTAVEHRTGRGGGRLVVRVGEADQALDSVAFPARLAVHANLRRFGAPIALPAGRLALSAAEVVEIADRLRREYEPSSKIMGFLAGDVSPGQDRALRSTRLWTRLASVGLGVLLFGVGIANIMPSSPATQIDFAFERTTGPGYMDQTLVMTNHGFGATAPTLKFVPLDRTGHAVPGVTVRTAYGSDRGLVVLPPRSEAVDVLAFDGPRFRDVIDIQVTVLRTEESKLPEGAVKWPEARRFLGDRPTEPSNDFDALLLHNVNGVEVAVRLVCILWEDPPPGHSQQMVRSLPIGGLVSIAPFEKVRVPVTEPIRSLARDCTTIKVYFSRPGTPVSV
ncbi:hypothetical protein AB0L25_09800 [Spirillospora sp. NPDC052242]